MQSRVLRFSRRPLAILTLCAIAAPTSTAWAQSARAADAFGSLLSSTTDDEEGSAPTADADIVVAPELFLTPIAFTVGAASRTPAAIAPLSAVSVVGAADTTSPAPAPAPAPDDDGSGLRTVGYVAGGVGLAGIALFAIAGLQAKSAYDKLNTECGDNPCTDEAHRSDIDAGRMFQTTANIGLAAGLTGLGVGATLLVLGSRSSLEKRGPSASVSPGGGMITYGGRF